LRLSVSVIVCLLISGCDRQSAAPEQASRQSDAAGSTDGDTPPPPPHPGKLSGRLDISQRGAAAPEVSFIAPDGSAARLADFRGRPVLLNLWATWCAPCVVEMPMLDALARREGKRLTVLAVSQDLDGMTKVAPFFARAKFARLQPYSDPQAGLGLGLQAASLPLTILYDSEGKEVWRVIGAMDWNGARAAALLAETLDAGG
jgi:thiol-disulfide isomerase/thioredoxin